MVKSYIRIKEWYRMVTLIHRKKQREPGQANKKDNTANSECVCVLFFLSGALRDIRLYKIKIM